MDLCIVAAASVSVLPSAAAALCDQTTDRLNLRMHVAAGAQVLIKSKTNKSR